MKNYIKISLFLFALSIAGSSFSQEIKKTKYNAAKNKPLKKELVKKQTVRTKVIEKK